MSLCMVFEVICAYLRLLCGFVCVSVCLSQAYGDLYTLKLIGLFDSVPS